MLSSWSSPSFDILSLCISTGLLANAVGLAQVVYTVRSAHLLLHYLLSTEASNLEYYAASLHAKHVGRLFRTTTRCWMRRTKNEYANVNCSSPIATTIATTNVPVGLRGLVVYWTAQRR